MKMDVLNYSAQAGNQSTVAVFSVYLPSLQMTIHKFRLIRLKNGKMIIGYPSYRTEATTPNGKPIYAPYFEFSKERGLEFEQKVFEALKPFVKG